MNTFYAVIVIYNKNYSDSETYRCLINNTGVNIIVCDNSTKQFNNIECEKDNVKYINMNGNKGLSKAYNKVLEELKEKVGYLCLFDDDTTIPNDYFVKLESAILKNKADIYLPVVYDSRALMSPSVICECLVKRAVTLDEITDENITGINSAMAINLQVFNNYKYDEKYFLDYVDHAFIRDMKKLNKKISIIKEIEIFQDFSSLDYSNLKGSRFRFNIFKKDFFRFCNVNFKSRCFCIKTLLKRWLFINLYIRFYKILPNALRKY